MRESIDNCINVRHFAIKTLINISRAHTRGTSNSPRIVLALTRKIAHQGEKIFACHKYSKKVSKIEVPKSTRVIMRIV